MKCARILTVVFTFFWMGQNLYAQKLFLFQDKNSLTIKNPQQFKSAADIQNYLVNLQQQQIGKGYWEFSVDSVLQKNDTLLAYLHTGNHYTIVSDKKTEKRRINKANDNSILVLAQQKEKTLRALENNGYPFARAYFDSIQWKDDTLYTRLKTEQGKLITIDSFKNFGTSKITKGFIQNYLQLKSKQAYNETKILNIDKLLKKLPYAELAQPTQIVFADDKAHIYLHLNKRKVSSADFLIGFLPGSAGKKVLITGEVNLHLQNAFKRGEEIMLQWRKLQPKTQYLDIRFNYPYLFNTPLGVNFTFNLDKRDSSSMDLAWQLGLPFLYQTNNYIKGFYKYNQTIILEADTLFAKSYKKLPNNLDALYSQYGVQTYYEQLDNLFSPKKGFDINVSGSMGTKKIKQNTQIISISDGLYNYASLYDSIKRKSIKGDVFWAGNYYQPLGKKERHILKLSNSGGAVFNQSLLRNELLRIGGNKKLRGFDEESILVSTYVLTSFEYRFMLMRNSYFFTFFDWAYIQRKFNNSVFTDFPFGFGAGITFDTKIGIFGLTYALGNQKDAKLDFRKSKIHFGYIAMF